MKKLRPIETGFQKRQIHSHLFQMLLRVSAASDSNNKLIFGERIKRKKNFVIFITCKLCLIKKGMVSKLPCGCASVVVWGGVAGALWLVLPTGSGVPLVCTFCQL